MPYIQSYHIIKGYFSYFAKGNCRKNKELNLAPFNDPIRLLEKKLTVQTVVPENDLAKILQLLQMRSIRKDMDLSRTKCLV